MPSLAGVGASIEQGEPVVATGGLSRPAGRRPTTPLAQTVREAPARPLSDPACVRGAPARSHRPLS